MAYTPTFDGPRPLQWIITLTGGAEVRVEAHHALVTNAGSLVFQNERRQLLRAFTESRWLLVEQVIPDGAKPAKVDGVCPTQARGARR